MTFRSLLSAVGVVAFATSATMSLAAAPLDLKKVETPAKTAAEKSPPGKSDQKSEAVPPLTDIQRQFCLSNAATASDEHLAWQVGKIEDLEANIKRRIDELEAKRAEYMEWVKKRDEAMKLAEDGVVSIYAKMRPDAAAGQLAAMDDAMAAAVLSKLNPRNAAAVLAEMEPGRAARLTSAMVGPISNTDGKKT